MLQTIWKGFDHRKIQNYYDISILIRTWIIVISIVDILHAVDPNVRLRPSKLFICCVQQNVRAVSMMIKAKSNGKKVRSHTMHKS